jgi:hypothetical protein
MKAILGLILGAWLRATCSCRRVSWHFPSAVARGGEGTGVASNPAVRLSVCRVRRSRREIAN